MIITRDGNFMSLHIHTECTHYIFRFKNVCISNRTDSIDHFILHIGNTRAGIYM